MTKMHDYGIDIGSGCTKYIFSLQNLIGSDMSIAT